MVLLTGDHIWRTIVPGDCWLLRNGSWAPLVLRLQPASPGWGYVGDGSGVWMNTGSPLFGFGIGILSGRRGLRGLEPKAHTATSPQPVNTGKVHRQRGAPKEQK